MSEYLPSQDGGDSGSQSHLLRNNLCDCLLTKLDLSSQHYQAQEHVLVSNMSFMKR